MHSSPLKPAVTGKAPRGKQPEVMAIMKSLIRRRKKLLLSLRDK